MVSEVSWEFGTKVHWVKEEYPGVPGWLNMDRGNTTTETTKGTNSISQAREPRMMLRDAKSLLFFSLVLSVSKTRTPSYNSLVAFARDS